jgi:gluconolactonase
VSPAGQNLGTVPVPVQPTNCAFGDDDAQTLYITARSAVFKVRTSVPGLRPGPKPPQP